MINKQEVLQTIRMIQQEKLDIRTITMGISLRNCCHPDIKTACKQVYDRITTQAEKLAATAEAIELEYGIPIINKRISVTPIALVAEPTRTDNYLRFASTLEKAAHTVSIDFIGGFSALVHKGSTRGDELLLAAIPEALPS